MPYDQEILDRIRGLIQQPAAPLPPMTEVRNPLMMAIAGGFDPEFRRAQVDPLIQERRDRPMLERKYQDEQRQNEISGLTGVLEQQRSQGYANRAQGEYDANRQQEDQAVEANVQKLDAIGGEMGPLFGASTRLADILSGSKDPYDQSIGAGLKADMAKATALFQQLQKNPTIANDEIVDRLLSHLDAIDEEVGGAADRQDELAKMAQEQTNAMSRIRAQNEGRVEVQGMKNEGGGGLREVPPTAVGKMGEQRASINELDKVEALFNELGSPAGPFAGRGWSVNSAKFRASWEGVSAKLRTDLVGSAQGIAEVERISNYIATTDNVFLAKEKIINSIDAIRNHLKAQREGKRAEYEDFGFYVPDEQPSGPQLPEGAKLQPGLTTNGKKWFIGADGEPYEIP